MWTVVFRASSARVAPGSKPGDVRVVASCSHMAATSQVWLNKALADHAASKLHSHRGTYCAAPVPRVET